MIQAIYLMHAIKIGGTSETFIEIGPQCACEVDYPNRVLRVRHRRDKGVRVIPFEHAVWSESLPAARATDACTCPDCSEEFKSGAALASHRRAKHPELRAD